MHRYSIPLLSIFLLSFSFNVLSQTKTEFTSELFQIFLIDNNLTVQTKEGIEIYSKDFQNPSAYTFDIDSDGIDELFLIDTLNTLEYLLNLYNLLDTFYLAAEINSGTIDPYRISLGEIEGLIIVTGNSDFSYLNEHSNIKTLPINCWKYEDGELFSVNEELYEIFISENENLLSILEEEEITNCDKSKQYKSIISSIFVNYLNAGEITSADNFLLTFYKCEDLNSFKLELEQILTKGKDEI
jgi:hypothetical protein